MSNYNIFHVPFIAAFPNGPYQDQASFTIVLSGDYFLATAAADDFEQYGSGFINFFSGTGSFGPGASGHWGIGSGYTFLFTRYFANDFEVNSPTGIFNSGSWLNSGTLFSGYLSPFTYSGLTGSTFGIDNIYWEPFTGYTTGFDTGLFPGLFTNNYLSLLRQNNNANSGFANYNLIAVFEAFSGIPTYSTGFNTGLFGGLLIKNWNNSVGNPSGFANYNLIAVFEAFSGYRSGFFFNPFGHVSLNNPGLNSGLFITGWNVSNIETGITYASFPLYFINSGSLSGYWQNGNGSYSPTTAYTNFTTGNINLSGVYFSGTELNYPHNSVHLLNDFTVEFWFNPSGFQFNPMTDLTRAARFVDMDVSNGFMIRSTGDSNPYSLIFTVLGNDVPATFTYNLGQWNHVCCVRSGSIGSIYFNGVFNTSATISSSVLTATSPLSLGQNMSNVSGGENYTGSMDEFRLWSYAKQPSDILANYNTIVNPNSSGLINYLRVITP